MELIPGLPEEIGLECLTQLPYTVHPAAARVCKKWRQVLKSPEFYKQRKQAGKTHKLACLVRSLPVQTCFDGRKPAGPPTYEIAVFDTSAGTWDRLDPIPKYPKGMPLFCHVASVERKLVVIGGWDLASWEPVRDVFVYDFVTREWRQGRDMPSKRSFFAAAATADGRVLVAGGHDEGKNALSSAWAYDVERDEWAELTRMEEERDECEGVVVGDEFWVVSGYGTEHQGRFKASVEAYGLETGEWRRVDSVWDAGRCPRGCVGVGPDGRLVCLADLHSEVRVGVYAVELGERTLVTGSATQGGSPGFFVMERKEGQNGKLSRIGVAEKFAGFVQSGCCLEI